MEIDMPGSLSPSAKADACCPLQCHHRPALGPVVRCDPEWRLYVDTGRPRRKQALLVQMVVREKL
jgi:hypothetical protein